MFFLCFFSPDNIIFEANLFVAISLESRNLQNTSNPSVSFQPWSPRSWFYLAKLFLQSPLTVVCEVVGFKQLKKRFDKRSKILVPLNCPNFWRWWRLQTCDGKHMSLLSSESHENLAFLGVEMWPLYAVSIMGDPGMTTDVAYLLHKIVKKYLWSCPNLGFLEGEPIRDDFHQQIVRPFLAVSQNVFQTGSV